MGDDRWYRGSVCITLPDYAECIRAALVVVLAPAAGQPDPRARGPRRFAPAQASLATSGVSRRVADRGAFLFKMSSYIFLSGHSDSFRVVFAIEVATPMAKGPTSISLGSELDESSTGVVCLIWIFGNCSFTVNVDGKGVFRGLPNRFKVTRYHSLVVDKEELPQSLMVTASTDDGTVMGVRHKEFFIEGVQFQPEAEGENNRDSTSQ